jgi:hypothetical protein
MPDNREECCKNEENLVPHEDGPRRVIKICKVCGRRHFEFSVEPGVIFAKGAPLGKAEEGA